MTTLLIAEHDNAHLKDATHKALSAAKALGGAGACAGRRRELPAAAEGRRQARGRREGAPRRRRAYEHQLAEPTAALIVSLAGPYDALVAPRPRPART